MRYFLLIGFSEQSDPHGQKRNPAEVLEKIRNGIEVGNTRLAVAALAAHIAATTNISLTGDNPPVRGGVDSYSNNRVRHRHPQHTVIIWK